MFIDHILKGLPEDHPCSRLHGHNYVFIFELSSDTLNEVGFIKDYRELDMIKKYIDDELDHKFLNDVFDFQPSAENMSKFLYDKFKVLLPQLSKVSVKETEKTITSYDK